MPLSFDKKSASGREPIKQNLDENRCRDARGKERRQKNNFFLQNPQYTMNNIVLSQKQRQEIDLAVGYYEFHDKLMEEWDLKKRYPENKGLCINIYGSPGTGKTMAAHAIADRLSKKICIVNYAEIESKYVGETSKNLVDLFDYAEKENSVLLFDEADALLSKRVTNMTNSTDVSVNQTKSVLLNILNDFCGTVVFTTNFITNYDYAFMRRIPFQIRFDNPDYDQRMNLWNYYLETGMPHEINVSYMAKKFVGVSGSDIANCILMSALHALIDGEEVVTENYFLESMERILRAKQENLSREPKIVSQREVSEEYALTQLNKK